MARDTEHRVVIEGNRIRSPRLRLRPWSSADAPAALAIYGSEDVTRWLSPAMQRVDDVPAMEAVIDEWTAEQLPTPAGRWAMELVETGELVGTLEPAGEHVDPCPVRQLGALDPSGQLTHADVPDAVESGVEERGLEPDGHITEPSTRSNTCASLISW